MPIPAADMRIDQYRQSDRVRYANAVVTPTARYRNRMMILISFFLPAEYPLPYARNPAARATSRVRDRHRETQCAFRLRTRRARRQCKRLTSRRVYEMTIPRLVLCHIHLLLEYSEATLGNEDHMRDMSSQEQMIECTILHDISIYQTIARPTVWSCHTEIQERGCQTPSSPV